MAIKMADLEPCFRWEPPSEFIKASKKATGQMQPILSISTAPQILNSDLPIGLRPLALLEGGSHLQDGQRPYQGEREAFSPIRPSVISPSPQRLRDQRSEARTSSTSSFRDSRYYGCARNPAKQHERAVTIRRFLVDSCFRQAELTEDVHLLKDTSHVAGLPTSLCDRL
ncbi:unnamed protein product [Pleuronectes platessa]|uniref:Uncharacterized protein n=1 Tax=Pleuronectes platessa TaxID=8262 RepID=A0A9N7UQX0_PLEPL|nr:unnamed protein product [Pleuronectes platessa]